MPSQSPPFDIVVITAANEAQAKGYRAQLETRAQQGLLRDGTIWRVVTDPGGRRVGSGSSTLAVLAELAATVCQDGSSFRERFSQHRILIAHSGGDARRIPAYAAQGKIFMPLPCDVTPAGQPSWQRHPAALFDLILQALSRLPAAPEGEIIICAGDVLLTFNSTETNLHTPGGITGLGFAVPPDIGQQHGVYVSATPSLGGSVVDFLQKPSRSEILESGAIDLSGRVLVDTGVFCIAPLAAEALLQAAGIHLKAGRVTINAGLQRDLLAGRVSLIDLYREVALALPATMTRERYLGSLSPSNGTPTAHKSFGQFFDRLRDTALPFNVAAVPDGEFFHIGTTHDLLTKFIEPSRTARVFHFQNGYHTQNLNNPPTPRTTPLTVAEDLLIEQPNTVGMSGLTMFNTVGYLDHLQAHGLIYIENTVLTSALSKRTLELAGDNILVGLRGDIGLLAHRSHLPPGVGLTSWPVRLPTSNKQDKQESVETLQTVDVPIAFGIQDDNKATYESGLCRLLNAPIELLIEAGIAPDLLWPAGEESPIEERSAWTAKIWCAGQAGWDTIDLLLDIYTVPPKATQPPDAPRARSSLKQQQQRLKQWRAQPRWSLSELLPLVNHEMVLGRRRQLAANYYQRHVLALLLEHPNLAIHDILAQVASGGQQAAAAAELLTELQQQWQACQGDNDSSSVPPLTQARIERAAGVLAEIVETQGQTQGGHSPAQEVTQEETAQKEAAQETLAPPHTVLNARKIRTGKTPQSNFKGVVTGTNFQQAREFNQAALNAVARALESTIDLPHEPRPAQILHDQVVWVTAPARIDFAGGWSDTPPICLEQGGMVLNAAVTINRQYPIQVVAKLNEERCIRLTSIDLGQQEIYTEAAAINGPPDLRHWSSLAKVALVLAGIVPERVEHHSGNNSKGQMQDKYRGKQQPLSHWLDTLGGGIDLTLFSGLPKGSGMGTSSILGAAVLACLSRVHGRELTHPELIAQTSLLEQRMTSGGGWQDQVGGIVPGVKLICTDAGMAQVPHMQWTIFGGTGPGADSLHRRMLLYFTGQKRVARDILQKVLWRYLAREPEVLNIIDRLKAGAETAKQALAANDLAAFSSCVADYWELKKAIDPGSTNATIEAIIEKIQPYTAAHLLCGAGGGGFMLMIARDEEAIYRIRQCLQDDAPNPHSRFFDFAIDHQGLAMTVL